MKEAGIDISGARPKSVDRFLDRHFDYVITVCDHAREMCPVFSGRVGRRLHFGFEDPAEARGTSEQVLRVFRHVRDRIRDEFERFYRSDIRGELSDSRSRV
jgi:arsenate reductase